MDLTEAEIKDRLDKWFGLRFASYPQPMLDAIRLVVSMPDGDRERTVSALKSFFCFECGYGDPNCPCSNDE